MKTKIIINDKEFCGKYFIWENVIIININVNGFYQEICRFDDISLCGKWFNKETNSSDIDSLKNIGFVFSEAGSHHVCVEIHSVEIKMCCD